VSLTTDPDDPRLGHGVDPEPIDQHDTYLVLSEEERARGFVRPVRRSYLHVGVAAPHGLQALSKEEWEQYADVGYVGFEPYEPSESPATGRYWTQAQLDRINGGCGALTWIAQEIAETYARDPSFYGSTYCAFCRRHLPVGAHGEFVWDDGSQQRVGT
jgi:hypothetical protein